MMTWIERSIPYFSKMLTALQESLMMLSIALFVSFVMGLLFGILIYMTRPEGHRPQAILYRILNIYVNVIRSFPFMIFIVFIAPLTRWVIGTSFGTYAAAFPLSLVGIALYARLVEQSLYEVPEGIIELARTQGVTQIQFVRYFLLSEVRSGLVLGITSVCISLVSYSTVMGAIGGGGIGAFAMLYGYQDYRFDLVIIAVLIMLVMVSGIQFMGSKLAKKLDKR